ncbi:MAG: endolytic transglycosylase MltG [Bacteroidota bacterium]|jgi:UPF0755 protein
MLKKILIAIVAILAIGLVLGRNYYTSNVKLTEKQFLYIPTGSNFEQLKQLLQKGDFLKDLSSFESLASKMGYANKVKPGRYEVQPGMSNWTLIRMLRSGNQKPVKLVINKYRLERDLAGKIGRTLEADSNEVLKLMNDNVYLKQFGLDSNTSIAAFMPNTYEFYWNTPAAKVFEKIAENYKKYWTSARVVQAKAQNLTPAQAVTLASIVEEETNNVKEKPTVASVYLNRLRKGIKLDADPTCKFAVGDFSIKRVLTKHTQYASPYNTYLNAGLPPGPICTPSESSIEAVLNPASTNYLFFCAHENMKQEHKFAETYAEHQQNAERYQAALTEYLKNKKK